MKIEVEEEDPLNLKKESIEGSPVLNLFNSI